MFSVRKRSLVERTYETDLLISASILCVNNNICDCNSLKLFCKRSNFTVV
jgi:hypothetical protein